MRLFVAFLFEEKTHRALLDVQERLRKAAGRGNFTRPQNLHLTLGFLGETPPERLSAAKQAVTRTPMQPLALVFDHLGSFRQQGNDLWWAGLRRDSALTATQRALAAALAQEGFRLENRRFQPHLTLARQVPPDTRMDRAALLPSPIAAPISHISLMLSERIDGVLTYTELFSHGAGGS
ncbi:MAG: RNA 2',3'-cyclic phosphodiesterase [Intestinibacillus sp.]